MKELTEEQALNRLAARCAETEYCTGDAIKKMEQWGIDADAQLRIIKYLTNNRYIDDSRYCFFFVKEKISYNGWGRRKIEQALYAKHIDSQVYKPILDEVPDEHYIDILRPLLYHKWNTIQARNDYERSQKLIRFAMGRGFDLDIIRKAIDTLNLSTND